MEVNILPFLKKRPANAGLVIAQRAPDKSNTENQDDSSPAIEACVEDLITAIHSKDVKAAKEALMTVFEYMESEPHYEGDHTNES